MPVSKGEKWLFVARREEVEEQIARFEALDRKIKESLIISERTLNRTMKV